MRHTLLHCLVSVLACSSFACSSADAPDHSVETKKADLVGGNIIGPETHPGVVIWISGNVYCTGSFITPQHILTAAHCTQGRTRAGLPLSFTNGTYGYMGLSQATITGIFENPYYSTANYQYDVAVIALDAPVAPGIVQVETATSERGVENPSAVGYGCQTYWGSPDGMVRKMASGGYAFAYDLSLLVSRGWVDFSLCPGDSGGPLLAQDRIVGIASTGRYDLSYGAYARVDLVVPWLVELGVVAPPPPSNYYYDGNGGGG